MSNVFSQLMLHK